MQALIFWFVLHQGKMNKKACPALEGGSINFPALEGRNKNYCINKDLLSVHIVEIVGISIEEMKQILKEG